jgi:hypothetical protein
MLAKTKIALALLLAAAATAAPAESARRKALHGAPPSLFQGHNGAGLAPFTQAERDWFERASRPSNL